jgi:hypothetical protein
MATTILANKNLEFCEGDVENLSDDNLRKPTALPNTVEAGRDVDLGQWGACWKGHGPWLTMKKMPYRTKILFDICFLKNI